MAKKQEKEIERWVTVNGARVPIFKDGSIGGPKALRDKVKAKVKDSGESKKLKPRPYKSSYYSEDQLKDEKFRKDALDEMKKHERNWSYYPLSERKNISPNGIKELRERIKEIENYNKSSTKNFESMSSIELSSVDLKKLSDDEFSKLHKVVKNKYPDKLGLRSKIIEESNRRFFEQSKKEPGTKKKSSKSDDKIKPYAVYQPEKILGEENRTRLSIKYAKSEKEAIEQYKKDYPKAKDIGIHESKAPEHQKKAEQFQKESTTKEKQISRNKKEADDRNSDKQITEKLNQQKAKALTKKQKGKQAIREAKEALKKYGVSRGMYKDFDKLDDVYKKLSKMYPYEISQEDYETIYSLFKNHGEYNRFFEIHNYKNRKKK